MIEAPQPIVAWGCCQFEAQTHEYEFRAWPGWVENAVKQPRWNDAKVVTRKPVIAAGQGMPLIDSEPLDDRIARRQM